MKTLVYKIILLLLLINIDFAVGQSAYMRIVDKDFIPINNNNKSEMVVKNSNFRKILNKYKLVHFHQAFPTAKSEWLREAYFIEMESEKELDNFIQAISEIYKSQIPLIEKLGKPILTADAFYPNDSLYVIGNLSHLDYVRAPEAWNITKHYGKVKVGITDTYFYEAHPDLSFDAIYGSNSYINENDHGTIVSGFISGITNNQIGVASVGGFNTTLVASSNSYDNEVLLLAQLGCKVINCSWINGYTFCHFQDSLYNEILNTHDCLVVFGAGNWSNHGGSLSVKAYPASYSACMSVTSVGHKYDYGDSGYRNWKGVHCMVVNNPDSSHHHNEAVDVCAPGYEMQSTNYWRGQIYTDPLRCTGTSFAAPIVTGIAAMVRAVNPNLTAAQTMQIIKETADASIYDIPENAPYIGQLGTGLVNAYAAVRKACAVDVENETYTSDETLEGCIVTLKNVNVQNSSDLVIDAVVEAELISNVEIPLGCSLEIR